MVTEEQAIVPESAFADYEEDLIRDGLPPDQARATRRALERIVDRFALVFATKADLRREIAAVRAEFLELRSEFSELRSEFAELRAEVAELRDRVTRLEERVRILTWVVGLGALGMMGMMAAILARL